MLRHANEAEPSEDGVSGRKPNIANFPRVVFDCAVLDMARIS